MIAGVIDGKKKPATLAVFTLNEINRLSGARLARRRTVFPSGDRLRITDRGRESSSVIIDEPRACSESVIAELCEQRFRQYRKHGVGQFHRSGSLQSGC